MTETTTLSPGKTVAAKPRDPRLDFFRGLGMFIILIAHIPWNPWADWIPARFGFSDAADMFVFCSGMASALAFARIFTDFGWLNGAARILHRIWQVYWAHVGCFLVTIALYISVDSWLGEARNIGPDSPLNFLFTEPRRAIVAFLTLTWAPNYFDILPMYIAILAMIPVVMGLARFHPVLAGVFVVGLWLGANFLGWTITGDGVGQWGWFFNPFAWQLLFFTGFAFARGWLPAPPRDRRLMWAAIIFCVVCAPVSCQYGFGCHAGWGYAPALGDIREWLQPAVDKTYQGPLRYLHFLATAYLAWMAAGPRGANLKGPVVDLMRKVGQQTLAVFLVGIVAAQALGMALEMTGRTFFITAIANIVGIGILVATALITGWFKSPPWRKKATARPPAAARETAYAPDAAGAANPA